MKDLNNSMLNVEVYTFNAFSENTIILWDEDSKESAIIDPGASSAEEENILTEFIESKKIKVKYLINTHCHIDHILGCRFVKDKFDPIYFDK